MDTGVTWRCIPPYVPYAFSWTMCPLYATSPRDPDPDDYNQCCGSGSESGSGSTGSTCFWPSWTRIRIH
jgi:hypothetical protein